MRRIVLTLDLLFLKAMFFGGTAKILAFTAKFNEIFLQTQFDKKTHMHANVYVYLNKEGG